MEIPDLSIKEGVSPDKPQSQTNVEDQNEFAPTRLNRTQERGEPVDSNRESSKRKTSPRKLAANRANAQRSAGPRTAVGKRISSWNSLRHGLLSNRLIEFGDQKHKQFTNLLESLQQDLEPVGALEQVLVEKIAHEYWRLGVAAYYESEELPSLYPDVQRMANLIRYETMINHQLFQAINQFERLQRMRQGEAVLPPVSVQLSHDHAIVSHTEESSE